MRPLHSLLDDPLLGVEDDAGLRATVTLPGLLARLSSGTPTALTALQAHQQHPVHAFLVQLAALALSRAGTRDIEHDEGVWRALLVRAAARDRAGPEAFALVVPDLRKPAFLQPPVPERTLEALRHEHSRPSSELDVLITARNHDVKADRVERPSVEHWIFALLTLQTMQGFLGAGNYGIARMNGGFASRPCVAFAPDHGAASRFVRDVKAMVTARFRLTPRFSPRRALGLVWCASWNGKTSLRLTDLDPFFVEICRRIRLSVACDGSLVAHRGPSKVARIEASDVMGNTGDAWTPVTRKGKALTLPEQGFGYARVQDLLFGDWTHGAAGSPRADGGDRLWIGQVLVRGQGKTHGYHERCVSVPQRVRSRLAELETRDELGARADTWVHLADAARYKVFKIAVLTFLQGGPERLNFGDDRAGPVAGRFDASVDDFFFPMLFDRADDPPEIADAAFETALFTLARRMLEASFLSLPVSAARRWRAEAHARRTLVRAARTYLPLSFGAAKAPLESMDRGHCA